MKSLLHYFGMGLIASTAFVADIAIGTAPAVAQQGNGGKNADRGNGRNNSATRNGGRSNSRAGGSNRNNGGANRNNGNQGNGQGAANRANAGQSNGNSNGNGQGTVVRDLRGLNAGNASTQGLSAADTSSQTGKLYAYQQARLALKAVEVRGNASYTVLYHLQNMTAAQIAAQYPGNTHAAALAQAQAQYASDAAIYTQTAAAAEGHLMSLTGGRALSAQGMAELEAMLGL